MRTTVIPAQITTVEDKIAGNLSLTQIILLIVPVFVTAFIYALVPPVTKFSIAKTIPIILVSLIFFTLAIRIKGRIVFNWLTTIIRFNQRPSFYLHSKTDTYDRPMYYPDKSMQVAIEKKINKNINKKYNLSLPDKIKITTLLNDPNFSFSLKTKKGGLNVAFEQIKA